MKIEIARDALTQELFKVQGVVNQKSTLAILSNALLVAEDGTLTIHATDLDVTISTSCACEVGEPGRVTLQAKKLFDVVKGVRAAELSLSTEENNYARIEAGQVGARLPGMPAESFANISDYSGIEFHPIGTARLLDMIEKTLFSISTDEGRPNLNGAFFRIGEDGSFAMVSTDGHRLSRIALPPDEVSAGANFPELLQRGVIISRKGLGELKRVLDAANPELSFGLQDNNIVFRHGPTTVAIRLIDGSFPDVDQVLPRESDNKARINRGDLIHTLKFAAIVAPPKTGNVRISFRDGECEIYTQDAEQGEAREVIAIEYDGAACQAGYNYRYLLDVLAVLDSDEVTMEIIDTLSPTMIRDGERDDMLFVVMPMRI
jgi:DNA polymerase III subunit beta